MPVHSVAKAAVVLKVTRQAVNDMIRRGAPVVRLGSVGPGNGSLVDTDQIAAWRASQAAGVPIMKADTETYLDQTAGALHDALVLDGGYGEPLYKSLQVPRGAAAALLFQAYQRIANAVTTNAEVPLPTKAERLLAEVKRHLDDE